MGMSRMSNASRNGAVTLLFFVVTTLLGFFSRKIMLVHLGTELLGLNTALNAVIDFMLLMELGITSAVGVSLYKPLATGDVQKVNEIMWLFKYLYRILAGGIVGVGILFAPLLPFVVEKSDVTLWQTYVAYFVFLLSAASNYFFGYGRVLFQADQRNFIPVTITNSILITKTLCQIGIVLVTDSYWGWLACELIFQVGSYVAIEKVLYRRYCALVRVPSLSLRELVQSYRDIFHNAKRIAVHQFSGFVLKQSDNIIIATMINLSTVTLYGNYALVNNALNSLLWNVLQNAWAGVGNLVAVESKERIYAVYKEYLCANFFISVVINLCVVLLVDDFIRVWLGEEYILSRWIIIIMAGTNVIGSFTNASSAFTSAYKLFGFVWIPVVEAGVNIILSILGAYWFGLLGVLMGTLAAVLISAVWKPVYLHKWGMRLSLKPFVFYIGKLFGLFLLALLLLMLLIAKVREKIGYIDNFMDWFLWAVSVFVLVVLVFGGILLLGDKNFNLFLRRVLKLFLHKS